MFPCRMAFAALHNPSSWWSEFEMPLHPNADRPVDRILVVDDDPIFAGLASAALTRAGCHVVTACDGVEGLERLDREPFDLALIDLSMPRVDGFRLIALIRGSRRHRHLAIMVASVRHDGEAFREALSIGANAIQTKPLDFRLLAERIRDVIDTLRQQREAGESTELDPIPSARAG